MVQIKSGADVDNERIADKLREAAASIRQGGCQEYRHEERAEAEDVVEEELFVKFNPVVEVSR